MEFKSKRLLFRMRAASQPTAEVDSDWSRWALNFGSQRTEESKIMWLGSIFFR